MARARDTAAQAGFPDAVVDEDLREWDYGDYEGRTTSEIRAAGHPGWFLWDDGVPNGETLDDVAKRADRVIARARAADGDVLVFAHGHYLRVLASRWLDLDPAFGRHLELAPATLSVLGWEHTIPAVEAWNAPVA
jgi:probable phosphoglycerate mutase